MTFTEKEISNWREYESVRKTGKYNMFSPRAMKETSLSRGDWLFCITHYALLKQQAEQDHQMSHSV